MKGLLLYGAMCDLSVWDKLLPLLNADVFSLPYPRALTAKTRDAEAVARWAADACRGIRYDFILGHSFGGYVALHAAKMLSEPPEKLLLLESNPVPSGPFYRNLMTPGNMTALGGAVRAMLERERPYYGEALLASLRDGFDETEAVLSFPGDIYALYGDRGRPGAPEAMADLRLSGPLLDKMKISFIPDSCHLPMLENPAGLAGIINRITG